MTSALKTRNPELYNALFMYTQEAITLVKTGIDQGETNLLQFPETVLRKMGDQLWVRTRENKPKFIKAFTDLKKQIQSLSSYQDSISRISADEFWCKHFDRLVGSIVDNSLVDFETVMLGLPNGILNHTQDFNFDVNTFNSKVDRFESFFVSDSIEYEQITPLYGIQLTEPISLPGDVFIRPLGDGEINRLLNTGLIWEASFSDTVVHLPKAAVVVNFKLQKIIGEPSGRTDEIQAFFVQQSQSQTEPKLVQLLNLILGVAIYPAGTVTSPVWMPMGVSQQCSKLPGPANLFIPDRLMTEQEAQDLVVLWGEIVGNISKHRNFLNIAISRFSLAMTRPSIDDRIIDLMICAEALFLRNDHSEITYKLAHRAALFLGKSKEERYELFRFFKDAYSKRSKVVHGAHSFSQIATDAQELVEVTNRLSELLRITLLSMLHIVSKPNAPKDIVDWNAMMFD